MAKVDLTKLDFFQMGILISFEGQTDVSRQIIFNSSPDDNQEIREGLGALWKAKIISYNKANDSFTFPNYGLN